MCIIETGTKRCAMAYNIMPLSVFDVARNLDFFSKRQSLRYLTTLGPSLQGGNITCGQGYLAFAKMYLELLELLLELLL